MKIYLAARYGRRHELLGYANELCELGHTMTSTWIDGHHELTSAHGAWADQLASEDDRRRWALEDWADLARSDMLIAFTEQPGNTQGRGRGGRHVELGIALAWELSILVVGPRENIFCCLPEVQVYPTWAEALATLSGVAGVACG